MAERRPIAPPRRKFVARADLVALGAAGPYVDLREFMADLDRIVDQRFQMSVCLLDTSTVIDWDDPAVARDT